MSDYGNLLLKLDEKDAEIKALREQLAAALARLHAEIPTTVVPPADTEA